MSEAAVAGAFLSPEEVFEFGLEAVIRKLELAAAAR
jgi:hypothetical protein